MFLNTLENMAMLVNTNMFIDWFEFDFPDPKNLDEDYTLQHIISNLAHELITIQWNTVTLKHDVFPKLQSIQLQRKSTEEFAKELKLGTLMEKLDNYKSLSEQDALILLEEFLSRGLIYNNEECLETLGNCKELLRDTHCGKIIRIVAQEEDIEESCQEKLGKILSDVIDAMRETDLLNFLSKHQQYFTTPYANIEFNCDLEDVFYDPNTEQVKVLRAIAKNPTHLLKISTDIVSNTQKFNPEVHKQIIDHYIKALTAVTPKLTENSSLILKTFIDLLELPVPDASGLVHFFTRLYKSPILKRALFVKTLVIKNIGVKSEGVNGLMNASQVLLKLLDVDAVGLVEYLPMLLVGYGLVLDNLRGTLETYGNRAGSLLELVTSVMHKLVKVFLPVATKDRKCFELEARHDDYFSLFFFNRKTLRPTPTERHTTPDKILPSKVRARKRSSPTHT